MARVIVIAVDAWSKWLEYRVLPHLTLEATAAFLYEKIIARDSTPAAVRCHQGTECAGEFLQLCSYLGIAQHTISMLHPRANGLIEVYNQEVKAGIWCVADLCGEDWWRILPDIFLALRMLPVSKTGCLAFELVFK